MTDRFSGHVILLHGPPKIGKTTLLDSFPKPMCYIATETGYGYLSDEIKEEKEGNKFFPIESQDGWVQFTKLVKRLQRSCKFETVAVDTVSMLYQLCKRHLCQRYNVTHPNQRKDRGGLWSEIGDEFLTWLGYLSKATYDAGSRLVFVAHSKREEMDTATERGMPKISVALSGQSHQIVLARPDHVWYMGYEGDELASLKNFSDTRRLWIRGGNAIYAGNRDRGLSKRVKSITLPENNGYQAICKAYSRRIKKTEGAE